MEIKTKFYLLKGLPKEYPQGRLPYCSLFVRVGTVQRFSRLLRCVPSVTENLNETFVPSNNIH